jgi:hypothetical protein
MPTINNKPASASEVLRHLANQSEKAGDAGADALGNFAKTAINTVSENKGNAVKLAGAVWVADKSVDEVIKALGGKDVAFGLLHPGTSGTDMAVAVGLFTASGLVASGIALKQALEITANLIDSAKKG